MSRWWLVACLLSACVHDSYRCAIDTDCNLGDGGRCEADHYCTHLDSSCLLTQRSYTDHSEALSGTCFVGEVTPLNYCAAGQPPAVATGCAALVCATVSACCTTGWSEACVLEAQQQCPEVKCDTRVSVAATHAGNGVEIYELSWNGTQWIVGPAHPELGNTATFLAPAPGKTEPRLAGYSADGLSVIVESSAGNLTVPIDTTVVYHDLGSVDVDRDLRDTLVLDYSNSDGSTKIVSVVKLDTGESRDIDTQESTRMAWGATADSNGFIDGYPDLAAGNGATYKVLDSQESNQSKDRNFIPILATQFDANATTGGGSQIHSFTWADVDGDGVFDVIAFGNSVRIHTGMLAQSDPPFLDIDCNPPKPYDECYASGGSTAVAATAYNGTVLPGPSGARILAAPVDSPLSAATHQIFAITINPDHTFSFQSLEPAGLCAMCAFESIIVRDIDGDGKLDILAIDTELSFYTALSTMDPSLQTFTFEHPLGMKQLYTGNYNTVRTSATGTPR